MSFTSLPLELWEKIIGEYGLLYKPYIDTIKMIPSKHNIMEPVYSLLQQYMDYICNLFYSIDNNSIINKPCIFNKKILFDIINYFDITVDNLPTISMNNSVIFINNNNKMIEIKIEALYISIKYYTNNKLHHTYGPAFISWYNNKPAKEEYHVHGNFHRMYDPAITIWYKNGNIKRQTYKINNMCYCIDGPASITYYMNGNKKTELHRISPINNYICIEFYKKGSSKGTVSSEGTINKKSETYYTGPRPHRIDGPAVTYWHKNGNKLYEKYYVNSKMHRLDGPAHTIWYGTTNSDGTNNKHVEKYYMNARLHREDGPAIISWHENGDKCSEIYYKKGVHKIKNIT